MISELKLPSPARVDTSRAFRTLDSTKDLRSLKLINCDNLPFIIALDPSKTKRSQDEERSAMDAVRSPPSHFCLSWLLESFILRTAQTMK